MATETDAARDRVLAARAILGEDLEMLEASARAAVDVRAKIRRSPGKAAAVAGGAAFVAFRGPQRIFRKGKRVVFGAPDPLPESMLPEQVDRALRELGDDGAKVRGALERDFARYAKQAARDRSGLRNLLMVSVAKPLLGRGARYGADWLFSTDDKGFQAQLEQVRQRAGQQAEAAHAAKDDPPAPSAKDAAVD
ncbi:MAG: hypothetical protein E4H24_01195 [Thermomicrobiales bacterium]|nr:MAG: hypothetical protein E4H24_01195 [Thermomicrobiales bacterium]